MKEKLAVIFPGKGYGKNKPLLYYAAKFAKQSGYQLIYLEYGEVPPVSGKVESEMKAAFDAIYSSVSRQLAPVDWADKEVLFIAKSIGSIAANLYAKEHKIPAKMVLFTPLDSTIELHTGNPTIYFTGENDPWIDHAKMNERLAASSAAAAPAPAPAAAPASASAAAPAPAEVFFYEGCNHSLESGDAEHDLENLVGIMKEVKRFIG